MALAVAATRCLFSSTSCLDITPRKAVVSAFRTGGTSLVVPSPKCRSQTRRSPLVVAASEAESSSPVEYAAAIGGLIFSPIVAYSLYTLKTTGCGLPPGPGGLYGAAEGIGFLVVYGIVGWSAYTKVKTGSGLPNGPYGLLGAAEGLSYLIVLASLIVGGLQIAEFGGLPSPVPDDRCFG
eukprot:TRINITY_DN23357_c0_g1_i1.p1 TRINITY_DN23357_c0_g1~~TRINITY_DN23357_c0_g1_i1.p1  ORF type:complete len:180 (+),score=10.98 TRINITY_DN23357_c0_g1_i1:130-669(+)